jgi:serine/threonine protein kinase
MNSLITITSDIIVSSDSDSDLDASFDSGLAGSDDGGLSLSRRVEGLFYRVMSCAFKKGDFSTEFSEQSKALSKRVTELSLSSFPVEEDLKGAKVLLNRIDAALSYLNIPLASSGGAVPLKTREIAIRCLIGEESVLISERCLGTGGQSSVYRGMVGGVRCAIKKPKKLEEAALEWDVLRKIGPHPNIVSILSVTDGELIQPEAENGDLVSYWKKALRGDVFLTARDLQIMCYQIADALSAVHDAGYIHRDLKPGNILVDREGNMLLADFGVATPIEEFSEEQREWKGTVDYSPIQALAENVSVDTAGAVDSWAFGILIWSFLHKEEIAHPCFSEKNLDPIAKAVRIMANGPKLTSDLLAGQMDDDKIDRFDPEGILFELMTICLMDNPSERLSMPEICQRLLPYFDE